METFKDILCRQVDTLQHVFDSCAENAPEPDGSSSDEPSCKYYEIYSLFRVGILLKGIVTDSNNIFLWHESEDINKRSLFPKFQLIPSSNFQVMHDYVCFIAPIDYSVK